MQRKYKLKGLWKQRFNFHDMAFLVRNILTKETYFTFKKDLKNQRVLGVYYLVNYELTDITSIFHSLSLGEQFIKAFNYFAKFTEKLSDIIRYLNACRKGAKEKPSATERKESLKSQRSENKSPVTAPIKSVCFVKAVNEEKEAANFAGKILQSPQIPKSVPNVDYSENIKFSRFTDPIFMEQVTDYFGYRVMQANANIRYCAKYSLLTIHNSFKTYGFTEGDIFGYLKRFVAEGTTLTDDATSVVEKSLAAGIVTKLSEIFHPAIQNRPTALRNYHLPDISRSGPVTYAWAIKLVQKVTSAC